MSAETKSFYYTSDVVINIYHSQNNYGFVLSSGIFNQWQIIALTNQEWD